MKSRLSFKLPVQIHYFMANMILSAGVFFLSGKVHGQICTAPLSGSYTINQTLPTAGNNFNSFSDFSLALTTCGVSGNVTTTVTPGTGPYTEQVIFQGIAGIGAAATVTIQGSGETITSDTAILQNGSNPNRHIIRLTDLQYFTINNLHVDMFPGSTGFIGIHILNTGNHITVSNCRIDMGAGTSTLLGAMAATGSASSLLTGGTFSFLTFSNNITIAGGYGAVCYGLSNATNTNNIISGNNISGTTTNGIYVQNNNGLIISGNTVNFNTSNGIQVAGSGNINTVVEKNFISCTNPSVSTTLRGIYVFGSTPGTPNKVINNVIRNMNAPAATVIGITNRTTGAEFYFNTIVLDQTSATGNLSLGFEEDLSNLGSLLRNNIFYITRGSSNYGAAIALASSSTVATAINSNYNVFYVSNGAHVAVRKGALTSNPPNNTYTTLPSWQAASGGDANSIATDPLFQAGTAIPQSGVINGQGTTIPGITTDILNVIRSTPPDPGAYEFNPPGNDAAITNFVLPPIPHCANTLAVQFVLTNAGGNTLNSVTINWTVNGVPQPVVNWNGPPLPSGSSTTVTLGTVPVTGSNLYNFTATSSNPNGSPDVNPSNDSYTYTGFRRGLEGVFTINNSAPISSTNYQAFQTIANDLNRYGVCSPVTINVLNGPYTEQAVFTAIPGTSSTNNVVLNGNNRVLQFNPTDPNNDHILQLNGVTYMTVQGLTVNSLHATQGRGIHITNNASKISILNNTVNVSLTNSTSSSFGIIISGANWLLDGSLSDSVVISGNTVSGGYSGIQLSGVHWTTPLTRIKVLNNTVLDWYGFGVYLSYTNNCLVSKNIIRRPLRTNSGSDAVTPAGITVPAGSLGFMLEKNRIYDLHVSMPGSSTISRGFYISGTTTAPTSGTLQNNLVYGMNNDGAQYGIQNNSVTGPLNIYHNTIVLNNATGASTSNTEAINLSNFSTQSGIDMRNNIYVVTRGGTGVKRIIDVSAASTSFVSNYNAVYFNAPGGTQVYGRLGSTNYNTFTDWQTQTGKDLNSVFADPQFVNPATGNFTPANPVVDGAAMGTSSVGVTDDILDVIRSSNPDPGAFEFVPITCTGANGGAASTSSGPFCTSGSGTLTDVGYSTGPGYTYQWQYSNDNFVSNINDLAGQTNPATASTGVISSTTWYRLKVTCSSGPTIAYSNIVSIVVNQPIVITSHPASQTVCNGTNVTFTVVVTGSNPAYQWRKNTINISGANSALYTITGVSAGDAGSYDVVITGSCGPVTSNAAVLTVNATTSISTHPLSQTVCPGANVSFSVTASGASLTYQWRKNGTNIAGATNATYTINGVVVGDAGNYDVIVTGSCGTVTSNIATLTVSASIVISSQPVSQAVCAGANVSFSVTATGSSLTYQWRKNGTNIGGATNAAYTINGVVAGDAGNYDVVITGSCGTVTSGIATLTVNATTVISSQPVSQTVCAGAAVSFSVTATGTSLTYQWRKNGSNIAGATNAAYTISNVSVADAGNYDVIVTGSCGAVTSIAATLTVTSSGTWIGVISSNWNVAGNWCGGIPLPATNIVIPSTAPNMPVLSAGNGTAATITINAGASLTVGAGGTLDIYGDLINNGTFNAAAGSLGFRGASIQSIPSFTTINVLMNGNGGVQLGGNAIITGLLTLTNGNMILGPNNLSLANSSFGSVASHIITNSTGMVVVQALAASTSRTIPVSPLATGYNPVLLSANAGHVTDNFTVSVQRGVFINGISAPFYTTDVVDRMWIINEATPGGSNVNITLQWAATEELNGFERTRCYVMHYSGGSWQIPAPTVATGTNPYTQTRTGVTSFSPFAVRTTPIPRPATGIYPNPAVTIINVVLDLTSGGPVTFSIYDAIGRLVSKTEATLNAGLSQTQIDINRFSAGAYEVKVSVGNNPEVLVGKIIKMD